MPRPHLALGAALLALFAMHCSPQAKPSGAAAAAPAAAPAKPTPVLPPNATPEDFDRLRQRYSARPDFVVICERDRPMKPVSDAIEAQQWEQAIALTDPWVARCPVDVDAHVTRTIAFDKLGRAAESAAERELVVGLVTSVLRSGDGKTPQTAFVVISVGEEFSTLGALGLRPTKQRVAGDGIHVVTVEKDGQTADVYFNATADLQRQKDAAALGVEKPPTPAP